MAKRPIPTQEELSKLLRYEPDTGKLFWLPRPPEFFNYLGNDADRVWRIWNSKFAGKEAFTALSNGYRCGAINNLRLMAHRVIWALLWGEAPAEEIDHINGDRMDNRRANLRAVTASQNRQNAARPSHNTSGVCGVSWHKRSRKWRSHIKIRGKMHELGLYVEFDEAVSARKRAERDFGFHINHGRVRSGSPN